MKRRLAAVLGGLVAVLALGGLAWLARGAGELAAWQPPAPGALPPMAVLTGQVVAKGACAHPAQIAADAAGRVYVACQNGRLLMLSSNAAGVSVLAAPARGALQIGFGPMGGLVIAAGAHGLLHVGSRDEPARLYSAKDDPQLGVVVAVDAFHLTPQMLVLSASDRAPWPAPQNALLEHAGRGALFRGEMRARKPQPPVRLLDGLQTPLALAIAPDDTSVLIAETGAARVLRYWLKGEKAGQTEVFAEHLPGEVLALSTGDNGRVWAVLDSAPPARLAAQPLLRRMLSRLPLFWQPKTDTHFVAAFLPDGSLAHAFRLAPLADAGRISSVAEHGAWLWLGSDTAPALVRVPLQALIPDAPPPPSGWESTPKQAAQIEIRAEREEDD